MSDSYLPLLKEIVAALRADTSVAGYVGARVYTDVPDNEVFPYITVQINSGDYSVKEQAGMEHTVQLNIYSRHKEPKQCGQIRLACYDVLNRNEAILSAASVSNIHFNGLAQLVKDSDGVTWFGVIQFRVVILP